MRTDRERNQKIAAMKAESAANEGFNFRASRAAYRAAGLEGWEGDVVGRSFDLEAWRATGVERFGLGLEPENLDSFLAQVDARRARLMALEEKSLAAEAAAEAAAVESTSNADLAAALDSATGTSELRLLATEAARRLRATTFAEGDLAAEIAREAIRRIRGN